MALVYDNKRMQDIKFSEKDLWQQYRTLWSNRDWQGIETLLNAYPQLKYKIFNAYNFNRLITAVNDGDAWTKNADRSITTNATENSLLGKFAFDYNNIFNVSKDFEYVGEWISDTTYKKNNLVLVDAYHLFYCISDHTSNNTNKPTSTQGNEQWIICKGFLGNLETEGIQVASTTPENLTDGDIWIEEVVL